MLKTRSILKITALVFLTSGTVRAGEASEQILLNLQQRFGIPESVNDGEIGRLIDLMDDEGRFRDVNYPRKGGNGNSQSLRLHPERLRTISGAYASPASRFHRNASLREKIITSMVFWAELDARDSNWWWRAIGYPNRFQGSIAMMYPDIKDTLEVRLKLGRYFEDIATIKPSVFGPEANSAEMYANRLIGAALSRNESRVLAIAEAARDNLFGIVDSLREGRNSLKEGITPDYGFNQHAGHGNQIYWGNYGNVYLGVINWWIHIFRGSEYEFGGDQLQIISDAYLEGTRYFVYNQRLDPFTNGRFIVQERGVRSNLENFLTFDPPRKQELQNYLDRYTDGKSDGNYFAGTKPFYFYDMLIHRRKDYYVSLRMTSFRTVCNSSGHGNGDMNYYTGAGAMWIMVDGTEYPRSFLEAWNWRRLPGTTVAQESGRLPLVNWGQRGTNGTNFAGSASDGTVAVSGFHLKRGGVEGKKSWFFFEDGFVALGAGIHSEKTARVQTTVNQFAPAGTLPASAERIHHNQIGYVALQDRFTVSHSAKSTDIALDHGSKPGDASYAYAVLPAMAEQDFNAWQPDFLLVANTGTVQAVRLADGTLLAVFYEPGTLRYNETDLLTVSEPVVLMYKPGEGVYAAAPYGYNGEHPETRIEVHYGDAPRTYTLKHGEKLFRGRTTALNE
ncbi:MAG: hypothetical protein JJU05_15725 [Verrucomicrobia bacterium]|nr:hypothetical protein [Verrucomicrobiota bacterium]MCH8528658.1 polysaccharide lyase beta-sandwich domain-containing protein [Kiritimatiellia bacterium]